MSTTKKNVKPFGIRDKVGYMFGDFGNDLTFVLSSMMLLKFYTDIMGVSAAIVGMMMMGARFVDAVTDITMGHKKCHCVDGVLLYYLGRCIYVHSDLLGNDYRCYR